MTAGRRPIPTVVASVAASAAVAIVSPPVRKQSSTSHSSSKPSRSAARANAGSSSGGHSGRNRRPMRWVALSSQQPASGELGQDGTFLPRSGVGEPAQGLTDLLLAGARVGRAAAQLLDLGLEA